MSNHVKKTKRSSDTPTKDKRRTSQPNTPTNPDMMATVFEPVNAEVRPAECHSKKSKKQKKVKKTKSQPKEDKTQERTVVESEPEELNRVQAQQPTTGHGSKEVTRKNGDMKSGARKKKKKSRDSEDTEERISEKVPVAESPDETRRPVISKALKVGKSTYTIVYSTSHGRQIPRFVPDEPAYYAVRKPTASDEKTAMEHNNGSSTPTPEGS